MANRLPLTVTKADKENVDYEASAGGLATGLASLEVDYEKHWIGWPGIHPEGEDVKTNVRQTLEADKIHPVFLSEEAVEKYYAGFSNRTIWPLFHYFGDKVEHNLDFWNVYKAVNEQFCEEVMKFAQQDDIIWIQDYHLMLLPGMLRTKLPEAEIGFFLHTPFPSFEIFRTLPWREDVLEGLLGSDLIGLHTSEYMRHFLSAVYRVLGHESDLGTIDLGTRVSKVDTFPMGIDYEKFSHKSESEDVKEHMQNLRDHFKDNKLILSVDRLDYTKGILQRLTAFDQFLSQHQEFAEQVSLLVVVVPSRDNIPDYAELKEEIDRKIGYINGAHGTVGWIPVNYYYRSMPFEELVAMYRIADLALLTPFRDGMNLIAKEFVASKADQDGVLVLSEMAGAAPQLPQALTINPNDVNDIAKAIAQALNMPKDEQRERMKEMQRNIKRQTVQHWANEFIKQLQGAHDQQLKRKQKELKADSCKEMVSDFRARKKRLVLLDYDGTLVPFTERPAKAVPDKELIGILEQLSSQENTSVVIISGRNHHTLDMWFAKVNVGLIAEHGAWYREEGEWHPTQERDNSGWKNEIRPILDEFADKTPGSFVEEKPYSLVWHYRKTDAWIADLRSQGLVQALISPCHDNGLQILPGHKVVEVKVSGMDKGTGAKHWLNKESWDLVFAAGDDRTDEDMFKVLPDDAYSIKVGYQETAARFNVASEKTVRKILGQLAE